MKRKPVACFSLQKHATTIFTKTSDINVYSLKAVKRQTDLGRRLQRTDRSHLSKRKAIDPLRSLSLVADKRGLTFGHAVEKVEQTGAHS